MTDTSQLTSLQLAVLRVLWDGGPMGVAEVLAGLEQDRPLAFTTVSTLLTRLEKRGILGRRKDGRQFLYYPKVEREEAQRDKVDELAKDLFGGEVSGLVHHLLSRQEVDGGELDFIKKLIAEREASDATDQKGQA